MLAKQLADCGTLTEKVAGKFLEWSWKLGLVNRDRLTSGARRHSDQQGKRGRIEDMPAIRRKQVLSESLEC